MKFSEVWGVTNFKPFSLGKYERKVATKNPPSFSRWGAGGKNAKFHHLNLLGAALRNVLVDKEIKKQGKEGQGSKSLWRLSITTATVIRYGKGPEDTLEMAASQHG